MILKRRRYITLVEMMIIITILTIITGVIGVNITRALKSQRFRTEVDLVTDTLRLAQDIMLILRVDAHMRVKKATDGKGIEVWAETDEPVPRKWEFVINRTRRTLTETHSIQFQELNEFPIVEGELDIRFQSGGAMMSRGIFRMSTHDDESSPGATNRAICLRGYPHAIDSVPYTGSALPECFKENEEQEDTRITRFTMQEILEDVEIPEQPKGQ